MNACRLSFVVLAGLMLSGCALGLFDEEGRYTDGLPTQAIGPYGKPPIDFDSPADEPYVLVDRFASLWNPSALPREDGGFRIWFGREEVDAPAGEGDIRVFGLASIHELPDEPPTVVLSPDAAWEQGRVASPCVLDLGNGNLVMFYEGGIADPAIGRADSTDGGASWQKHPSNPILTDAMAPGAAMLDGNWYLFYNNPTRSAILVADSTDGVSFTPRPEPVLTPRTSHRFAFDNRKVFQPSPVVEVTAANEVHFGLFYNGKNDDDDIAIGYAGSFDGVDWQVFGAEEPVVASGSPPEQGPTVVVSATRGVMFFSEPRQGRQRIAVATHP